MPRPRDFGSGEPVKPCHTAGLFAPGFDRWWLGWTASWASSYHWAREVWPRRCRLACGGALVDSAACLLPHRDFGDQSCQDEKERSAAVVHGAVCGLRNRKLLQRLNGWNYGALGSRVSPVWVKKASVSSGRYRRG